MSTSDGISVRCTDWADAAGAELRERQMLEILADIEGEANEGTAPSATDIEAFLVMDIDGTAMACAGLRRILSTEDSADSAGPAAEVKRMFVAPEHRGKQLGVTVRLMEEIEAEARRRGYKTLKLATGTRMLRARAFYEKQGFVQVPLFGPYLGTQSTLCYAKTLP